MQQTLSAMGEGGDLRQGKVEHERRPAKRDTSEWDIKKRGRGIETVGWLGKMSLGGSDQHSCVFSREPRE